MNLGFDCDDRLAGYYNILSWPGSYDNWPGSHKNGPGWAIFLFYYFF